MTTNAIQILLIDDDEDEFVNMRDLFSEITRSQFKITWKSSYKDGLAALCEQTFDACLLDYRLGEYTGIDLLKEANKLNISCPIIFLTGQGDFDLDVQAMQIGAADYIVKGQLNAPILERAIRYAMKHALDMTQLRENKLQILQQDRLASLGLLASSLAHEIGTPLGIIRSRAEIIEQKSVENPSLKKNMEIIISQIDKIAKLVNSLLHLARGKHSDHATVVNLNLAVQDVLNLVQHELDLKDILLNTQIENEYFVKAESGSLGQVLLNLLVNSIHAIEEAKQKGRSENHQIDFTVEDKGQVIKIFIKDTGCGIPEENLSQLFKPFFTTKEIGLGTGLGLATSYKIVHSWGGTIDAKNNTHYGATFEISLPKHT
jgi:two-component system sensor histidine kinase/response regulator